MLTSYLGWWNVRVLIVPTRRETEAVLGALPDAVSDLAWEVPAWRVDDLLMVEPGMGPDLAAAILPRLETLEPRAVWLYGWCGGLAPDLGVGDLVLADATLFEGQDGQRARIEHAPPDPLVAEVRGLAHRLGQRLVVGPVLTSDQVLSSVAQKQAGGATGAVAVEMEAGPLARWTAERSVPFVHLRVVLDPLESALPPTELPADEHGYARSRAILFHVLTHPREWPALWRLMPQMRLARRVMAEVMAELARIDGPLAACRRDLPGS